MSPSNFSRGITSFFQENLIQGLQKDLKWKEKKEEDEDNSKQKSATNPVRKRLMLLKSSTILSEDDENKKKQYKRKKSLHSFASKFGTIKDKIKKGGYFGEKALATNQPRGATIITNTECELLTIRKEEFDLMMGKFERVNNHLKEFMYKYIPNIQLIYNKSVLENLLYVFNEKTFEKGNHLTLEEEEGNHFYIVAEGRCDLYKKWIKKGNNNILNSMDPSIKEHYT